ncbi:MAG: hypothetical protein FWC33_03760 [Candidatus Bathyarchaeota archaeon]|nr:hypothetical protein [Candidatus Termiticorpusculum sp.]
MVKCKKCDSEAVVKSGRIRGKQRYKCRMCAYYFVVGDERTSEQTAALKALSILLYLLKHDSYEVIGKMIGRDSSLVYRWIRQAGLDTSEFVENETIKQWTFDDLRQFFGLKKEKFNPSKPLIVADGELWPGCLATVILQLPENPKVQPET